MAPKNQKPADTPEPAAAEQKTEPAEPKKDMTFRLLKPGRQFATNGKNYARSVDRVKKTGAKLKLEDHGKGKPEDKIDMATKNSFVPYQLILDSFASLLKEGGKSEAFDGYMEKFFESEVFQAIPEKYLNPVLHPDLVKKHVS
jgi:hypothetical protein